MPEPLRYQQRREAELDQQRSVRVPEIVQPDVMQPGQSFMFFHVMQVWIFGRTKKPCVWRGSIDATHVTIQTLT